MSDQAKWPKRGETSEDGKYYTHTDGRVYEILRSTLGSWETCALCSFKTECRGGRVVDCGHLQYFRVIEGVFVISDAEQKACDMARAMIKTCAGGTFCAGADCWFCICLEKGTCPARSYLADMKQPDAWEVKA